MLLDHFENPNCSVISIKGRAGTGKTLLTYDIAKEVLKTKEVLIVHCGNLNTGHILLRDDYGWNIIPAKNLFKEDLSQYYLIIIDEAQRIYPSQLNHIISEVKKKSNNCIFSYDEQQTLRRDEINNNIGEKIEKELTIKPFELTSKIRTNKEVASFIQCLFDKNKPLEEINHPNIELNYFENNQEVTDYLKQLKTENWKVINFTPSKYNSLPYDEYKINDEYDNAHTVIGQEYDNVVAVIDEYFYYKEDKLSTKNYRNRPYYHPTKMLFQIVSRTRIKLSIVIVNNQEVLSRCLEVLKNRK